VVGGGLSGVAAATAPDGWGVVLRVDAVVSWLAAVALLRRPSTRDRWRRVAAGWAPALPAAYVVVVALF
jgi:hypothetical protein